MKKFLTAYIILFSINSFATLDTRSWCNGQITHWNLYDVQVTPYNAGQTIGMLQFWMGFNSAGNMLPQLYWASLDQFYGLYNQAVLETDTTNLFVYSTTSLIGQRYQKAKGCFFDSTIKGTSYGTDFEIKADGIISRNNAGWGPSGIRETSTDADFFFDNHAEVTYGGITYVASVTFTQIR